MTTTEREYDYESNVWRGLPKFSCLDCPVYFFHEEGEAQILAHCRKMGHGTHVVKTAAIKTYLDEHATDNLNVTITLGYLCWNTKVASMEGVQALIVEAERLRRLGCKANIVVIDNGSTDGTFRAICDNLGPNIPKHFYALRHMTNEGISRGRNAIIDEALGLGSDYLMFMDGDIEIVPLSSYVMARYLECHKEVGCIGAYSSNYTKDREMAARALIEIDESRVKHDIHCAWTQYGLFRCKMFEGGIRFDVAGPFGKPGWGFEDDDLCFQMAAAGWQNRYFGGMKYLHRNIRSSWPNLINAGVNIDAMFHERKEYLITKWRQKGFDPARIQAVMGQQMPGKLF